jgi:hypothetical protein
MSKNYFRTPRRSVRFTASERLEWIQFARRQQLFNGYIINQKYLRLLILALQSQTSVDLGMPGSQQGFTI